ncbi:MAG: glutamyl-tRNA reductase [Deltaproteobacteria bacterium]|nr:glutamyl-tRNA reductase [Deltaproteobacteria bacterium]
MDDTYLTLLGLNHNTAPVEIREKMFIQESDIPKFLTRLKKNGIDESVVVSTCNRTEIYFHSLHHETSIVKIKKLFSETVQAQPEWLDNYTYTFHNEEACRHLFFVASGLDSLVIGEPEILGQVKDAYRIAGFHNATGFFLNKVFHKTFNVAKRIRTETKIGYNPLSISSMAIELAKNIFGELNEKKILVIGAGTMCRTALKYFQKEGLQEVLIANRTYQKARQLAEDILGTAYPFHELAELFIKVDMVLTSTGSRQPFIDRTFIHTIMKKRKNRPLFLIDIAVPRDIAPEVNDIDNVYLYNIDDLKDLSQKHLSDRLKESEKGRTIVEEEVKKFSKTLRQLNMNPLIEHIIDKAEKMRSKELKKTLQKLNDVDDTVTQSIDALTKTITNKLVHSHITLIKENSDASLLDIYRRYFHFEEENEEEMDNRD